LARGSTYSAEESGSYSEVIGADGKVQWQSAGSLTTTNATSSTGSEEGTVDATGELSSQDFQPLHQEHNAAGYSESGTTTTTTYGPGGEETTVKNTSQSSGAY
jgi:hypothetical protein